MNLSVGQVTLVDLVGQLERKEIIINRDYQRGAGVWPESARTYFIDSILEGYPFPKIYLYQIFSDKAKRPIKEIVDGQQRVTTIVDFFNDKFKLTSASKKYKGMRYSDLDPVVQQSFVSYQIEVSIILSATRSELLEMFRRINAYTATLSAAEKRHATFQGAFKWFVNEQADELSPVLEDLKILTPKQLSRMADSEFIADMIVSLEKGIVEKSAKNIESLYKDYDSNFETSEYYEGILYDFFEFLSLSLDPLHNTFMMKSYVVNSLFCAFAHSKYGLPNVEHLTDIEPDENFNFDIDKINAKLEEYAHAHEVQDDEGDYSDYVSACLSSTTKKPQREIRFKILLSVLRGH